MEQKHVLLSALSVGAGVGVRLLSTGQLVSNWVGRNRPPDDISMEQIEKELMRLVVDGRETKVTFEDFPYYLSEKTKVLLTSAAHVHLKHAKFSKHIRTLSPASRAIWLSGPTEPCHQLLTRTLQKAVPQEVEVVMGRKLQVLLGTDGCAYFPFEELCDRPRGVADYFGLFNEFHTLALDGIPIFGLHNRIAAYRFITLVDVMYENKTRLLCTVEGSPCNFLKK